MQGGAFCRPARCIVVCKDTDDGIAVVVGEFFAEKDLSAERIFVERSAPCVDDCVFHRNCDLREFSYIYHSSKRKGMLEHCPDQFLPKTKPKPNINLRKRKNSFLRTPKKHRKKTKPSREGGYGRNGKERPPQKKFLRENKEREPSKNLLGSVWFKREFFPLRRRLFLVGYYAQKGRGKGRNAETGRVRVGARPEIGGKAGRKEVF